MDGIEHHLINDAATAKSSPLTRDILTHYQLPIFSWGRLNKKGHCLLALKFVLHLHLSHF